MPGHKMGKGLPPEFLHELYLLDITEIPGMDNLQHPNGVIAEAQQLAAKAVGARHTRFLVNGSTAGILSMISTICKPGDKLIVGRDCHKSVINAMILAGVRPVYVSPDYDEVFGIPTVITADRLRRVIEKNRDAVGVFITRPNYYGICSDIEKIVSIVHAHNMLLLVDEAHGAHLGFHDDLPVSAMAACADICVQSAHKTLPSFTQSAYLHIKNEAIDLERLEFFLNMFQTTSPSYVLLAFLDIARDMMQRNGRMLLEGLLGSMRELFAALMHSGIIFFNQPRLTEGQLDLTRIVVNCRSLGFTGYETERVLWEKYNIQIEMADCNNIVGIATIADAKRNFEILANALDILQKANSNLPVRSTVKPYYINLANDVAAADLHSIMQQKAIKVGLKQSVGKISCSVITPYPPGIPMILPGERITCQSVETLQEIIARKGTVIGLSDNLEVAVVESELN